VTITVTGTVPASGLVYVTIHLDYGLKHTYGYAKNANDDAIDYSTEDMRIPNLGDHTFSVNGDLDDNESVQNQNTFKRNPGFGGIVSDSDDNPLGNITIEFWLEDTYLGSAVTDEDGFYYFYYKHKGRQATFTVECEGQTKYIPLKSNKFAEVNFVI
jgi:hypothetical protein